MATWRNWSGRIVSKVDDIHFVRSEADAQAIASAAGERGATLRVAGSGHSHAPLLQLNTGQGSADRAGMHSGLHSGLKSGSIIDTSGLSGVVSTNVEERTAQVWAGTPIAALGRPLHDAGLALNNQGDIDRQTIAGAVATGTHGTGRDLRNLSASVVGATVVLASGERVSCNAHQNAGLWWAMRLNLGAFGIVTRLSLQLRDAYKLKENAWTASYDEIAPQIPSLVDSHRHFEFFWHPQTDTANAKSTDESDAEPEYPLAPEGERCAWNYEVLANHRPHLHTEMEYSVPLEAGPACFAAIRDLIRQDHPDLRWPVEYRTLAADDVWLSTAFERETVTLSVHQDIKEDETNYYQACEEIFLAFGGRPHWGKMHYLNGEQLASMHAKWDHWWQARNQADPDGVFLNGYLAGLRP